MHIVKEISIFVQITIFCSKCWNKNEVCPDGKLDESYLSRLYFNLPFWVNNVTLPPYDINMKIIMPDMESNLSAGSQLVLRIPQAFVTTVSFCSTCSTISCQNDNTAHSASCNTFGEQREIYEWIGLFFKPPWKKFAFCTLKRNVKSTQKQPFFQGGLAHQKCYARVQPGHSVTGKYTYAYAHEI